MKKLTSSIIVVALAWCFSGWSVYARASSDSTAPPKAAESTPKPAAGTREAKANEKVRADMLKLLADARAGKVAPRAQQFPRTARNNLSTAAKIGIIAAIGSAIFLIVLFHDLSKD